MTTALTLADVKRLAHEVVAEVGEDFVYRKRNENGFPLPEGMDPDDQDDCDHYGVDPRCMYVHKDYAEDAVVMTPGCIAGRVLVKAGVPLDAFDGHEGTIAYIVVTRLIAEGHLHSTDPVMVGQYLTCIQAQQDAGTPYGEAVRIGDDRY